MTDFRKQNCLDKLRESRSRWNQNWKLWKDIWTEYRRRNGDTNYLVELINGGLIWNDCHRIQFWELGKENAGETVGYISFPHEWCPTAGFFALLNRTLCGLYFADRMGYLPIVANWDSCPYEEEHAIHGSKVVFEYYFDRVSKISVKSAMNSQNVVAISNPNMDIALMETGSTWYCLTDDYISIMGKIYRKYIRLNETIGRRLQNDIHSCLQEPENTLGVHYRGTDYRLNIKGHPSALSVEDYFEYIDCAMEKHHFSKIFLATDDEYAVRMFRKRYNKILLYEDVLRSKDETSVAFLKGEKENGHYETGYEVLRDAYTLGNCGGFIAGQSQVGVGVRIYRASREKRFRYMKIIDHGANTRGQEWMKYYEENIRHQK